MSEARVEPTIVVLSSLVWRTELTAELLRLGVSEEQAPRSAGHVLHRIVGHAGYRTRFLTAEDIDRKQEPTE